MEKRAIIIAGSSSPSVKLFEKALKKGWKTIEIKPIPVSPPSEFEGYRSRLERRIFGYN